jgi:hypothetical protein
MDPVSQNDYEEPAEAALRTQLGLRPTHYSITSDLTKEGHPDQRPCPAWCWVTEAEYGHEIDPAHPTVASHSYDVRPSVALSMYPGGFVKFGDADLVVASTLEATLHQLGQQAPTIQVAMRRRDKSAHKGHAELVRLSVVEARELAAVLTHLVQVAEGEAR